MKTTILKSNCRTNTLGVKPEKSFHLNLRKTFLPLFIWSLISLNFHTASGQRLVKEWDRRFGFIGDDFLKTVVQSSDGGYLLAGYSGIGETEFNPTVRSTEYWVVKISNTGTQQWSKQFGGHSSDQLNSAIRTSDGGYLLGGYSTSGISGDKTQASRGAGDYWIVKISSMGTKQWDRTFGGNSADALSSVIQTSDGGFLLAGYSISGISGEKTQAGKGGYDYWVVKVSNTGAKQWDKIFGGSSQDYLTSVIQTADGGYLLAGESFSGIGGDKTQQSRGGKDYWIVKISSSGIRQWDKRFGGSSDEFLRSVVKTSDGGYLLGGYSFSGASGDKLQPSKGGIDYWVVKVSSTGIKQWDRTFGGNDTDKLNCVIQSAEGGYLLAGASKSGISGDKSQTSRGGDDFWIVKITNTGTKQWDKRYGGSGGDFLSSVIQDPSVQALTGGYVLAGTSGSPISGDKSQTHLGEGDYWIVKTKFEQVIAPTAARTDHELDETLEAVPFALKASPNPSSDKVALTFTPEQTGQVNLQVYNSTGALIKSLYSGEVTADQAYTFELAAHSLPAGMYIARLSTETKVSQIKLILVK